MDKSFEIDLQQLKQWLNGENNPPSDETKVTLNHGQVRHLCGDQDVDEKILKEPIQVELVD